MEPSTKTAEAQSITKMKRAYIMDRVVRRIPDIHGPCQVIDDRLTKPVCDELWNGLWDNIEDQIRVPIKNQIETKLYHNL